MEYNRRSIFYSTYLKTFAMSIARILSGFQKQSSLLILFVFISSIAFSQTKVSGRIIGSDNKPVAGATVSVKGTTTATQTDNAGDFTISAPSNSTLVITAVGFSPLEVDVNGRATVNATIQTTSSQLEQVVVVGYGTQRRKDVTGAISSVTSAQIDKIPVTTAQQALQGRAAGVQIVNNDAAHFIKVASTDL